MKKTVRSASAGMTHMAGQKATKVAAAQPNQSRPSAMVIPRLRQVSCSPRARRSASDPNPTRVMNGFRKRAGLLLRKASPASTPEATSQRRDAPRPQ